MFFLIPELVPVRKLIFRVVNELCWVLGTLGPNQQYLTFGLLPTSIKRPRTLAGVSKSKTNKKSFNTLSAGKGKMCKTEQ